MNHTIDCYYNILLSDTELVQCFNMSLLWNSNTNQMPVYTRPLELNAEKGDSLRFSLFLKNMFYLEEQGNLRKRKRVC